MITERNNKPSLIALHPKLVEKWARRYIKIYTEEGAVYAKRWATTFLPEDARLAMSRRVKEILGQKDPNDKGPTNEKGPE